MKVSSLLLSVFTVLSSAVSGYPVNVETTPITHGNIPGFVTDLKVKLNNVCVRDGMTTQSQILLYKDA